MKSSASVRCVTWNVHRAKGTDGRKEPRRVEARIADEIAAEKPDILALQEADEDCRPHSGIFDIPTISQSTGLAYCHDTAALRWGSESHGFLGTILFLSPAFQRRHADIIDLPGHCHRGAIAVEAVHQGKDVRVVSTHLSLSQPLRVVQMRILGQYLRRRPEMQTILLGDFNEWRPWPSLTFHSRILGTQFRGAARASFPSQRPVLPLDRVLTDRGGRVMEVRRIFSSEIRVASDHVPIFGKVTLL